MTTLFKVLFGLLVGGLVVWTFKPDPDPIKYTEIRVDTIIGEPDTIRTFVDRIVYVEREPEVTVVQPGGGTEIVEDFCKPDTVIVEITDTDTIWAPADTVFLVRSVTHDPGWFLNRDRITLFGPTSVGDLQEVRYKSYGGWSFRTDTEILFREPRFGWWREVAEAGIYIGIGFLGGKLIW